MRIIDSVGRVVRQTGRARLFVGADWRPARPIDIALITLAVLCAFAGVVEMVFWLVAVWRDF